MYNNTNKYYATTYYAISTSIISKKESPQTVDLKRNIRNILNGTITGKLSCAQHHIKPVGTAYTIVAYGSNTI